MMRSRFSVLVPCLSFSLVAVLSSSCVSERPLIESEEEEVPVVRRVDAEAVSAPPGFKVEVWVSDLDFPTDVAFAPDGRTWVAESGPHGWGLAIEKSPPARILEVFPNGEIEIVYDTNVPLDAIRAANRTAELPEGLIGPIGGLTYHPGNGLLYVSHRGRISTFSPETREFSTIIDDLPTWGAFPTGKVIVDTDGTLVFAVPTQGNAGVIDESWLPFLAAYRKFDAHEVPGEDIVLTGKNFPVPIPAPLARADIEREIAARKNDAGKTRAGKGEASDESTARGSENISLFETDADAGSSEAVLTGAFVPIGTETPAGFEVAGQTMSNGGLYRARADGSEIQRIAWGFRNPFGYGFTRDGHLLVLDGGADPIAPRSIYRDWDAFYEVEEGAWYGWPDFRGGLPVTDPRFRDAPDEIREPAHEVEFLLTEATHEKLLRGEARPPAPLLRIEPHSGAQSFTFGRRAFGLHSNEVLVAEFGTVFPDLPPGDSLPGFRVSKLDLDTGRRETFLGGAARGAASVGVRGEAGGSMQRDRRSGGLERPLRVEFAPDGSLVVVDWGILDLAGPPPRAHPDTGVLWRVSTLPAFANEP